ncbi:AraC family transcriptional regulator [Paenibacillus thalictri]|uniref:AraC family transcriptional regulator n=1 Tax=Paenibacillus thalictri TaxID=2527873 RepID=A0A4Q9DZ15_9BACL|nr:AraC family transcriptional regulator [Paenibacillus thalictri]TBL81158.1 AraC family transcriptional regulator [Paenibacillus thalictri]
MKNSLFYRILLSYTPIFFVIISVLIVIFYVKINHESQNQINRTNELLAQHISRNIDSSLQLTEYVILNELLTDEKIKLFYDAKQEIEPFLAYQISRKLSDMSNMFPYLNDVYVYNKTTNEVITKNTVFEKSQFLDRPFIESVLNRPSPYRWSAPRAYKEFQDVNATSVVTIAQKVPLSLKDQGIIVANVRTSNIIHMIEEATDSKISHVQLLDADNRPFSDQNTAFLSADSVHKEKSAYTGWVTATGLKDTATMHFLSIFSDVWTIIGMITIVIGIGWLTYVTHRNYKPVQTIIEKIDSYSLQLNKKAAHKKGPQEFNFIMSALDKLIEQSNNYEKQHKEDLIYRRKLFFRELVDGTRAVSETYWRSEMEQLELPSDYFSLTVVIVELDKYAEYIKTYSHRDQQLFKYVLNNVIGEISAEAPVYVWSEWREANQLCSICIMKDQRRETQDLLYGIYNALRAWVEENLQFTVSVGIGSEVNNASELTGSFEKAHEALAYKSSLGSNRIIGHWDIQTAPKEDMYPFMQMTKALTQQFKLGEDWQSRLAEIFARMKENLISKDEVQNILSYLVFHVQKELQKLEETSPGLDLAGTIAAINECIEKMDTVAEIEGPLTALFEQLSMRISSWRDDQSNYSLIVKIKEYITLHHANKELSLQHLSDEFGLSPRYVSKLFKDTFGEKFVDYLTAVRMEQAKLLLLQSSSSVQDIADKVGYANAISFIRTFKRIVGQTPGEFRKADSQE